MYERNKIVNEKISDLVHYFMNFNALKIIKTRRSEMPQKAGCAGNIDGQTNGQTNRRNNTNFKRNLAMMVMYVPIMFEFDWTKRFRVRVRKRKC